MKHPIDQYADACWWDGFWAGFGVTTSAAVLLILASIRLFR